MLDLFIILAAVAPAPSGPRPSMTPVWYGLGTLGGGGVIALVLGTLGKAALEEWKNNRIARAAEAAIERDARASEAKEAREAKERSELARLDAENSRRKIEADQQQAMIEEFGNIAKVNAEVAKFQAETTVHQRELTREMKNLADSLLRVRNSHS